ncbi:MAG: hypothetical protein U0470_04170 [Anaerolineae bacterium]
MRTAREASAKHGEAGDGAGTDADAPGDGEDDAQAAIDFTGMAGARYFVLTQVEVDGRSQLEANATFDGERTGAAAWLAAPGPMGARLHLAGRLRRRRGGDRPTGADRRRVPGPRGARAPR